MAYDERIAEAPHQPGRNLHQALKCSINVSLVDVGVNGKVKQLSNSQDSHAYSRQGQGVKRMMRTVGKSQKRMTPLYLIIVNGSTN